VSAFEVTTSDLAGLAGQLSSLLGELSQAGDIRSASTGAAENAQLEGAMGDFINGWSQSLETLQANLTTLTQRLASAGSGYEDGESAVAGTFGVG
jgi:uncharacterized protein YukE